MLHFHRPQGLYVNYKVWCAIFAIFGLLWMLRMFPFVNPVILALKIDVSKEYDISPKPCASMANAPFLVLIVFSRPNGFELRQTIRDTWARWASLSCGVRVLFMLGRVYDEAVQLKLRDEAVRFGDIIQSNQFYDTYRAASHKAIQLLQWSAAYCPTSTYTAKIDDDNWLNLHKYYRFLQDNQVNDFVYGAMFQSGSTVLRDPSSKYYVPMEEYDRELYPEYLSGVLYAFKTKLLPTVIRLAKKMKVTFNDDVYITGLVATAANLRRKEVPDYAWDHNIVDSSCPKLDKMCIHYSKPADFYRLWNDSCHHYNDSVC